MILGFEKIGQGKHKVIVLHDWFCDHTSYLPALPYLNQQDFEYAFLDLRGYGKSKHLKGRYSLEEATQDILETADSLGWEAFHLIGYSMTGLVGQLVCAQAIARVKSFTAVTPVTARGMPEVPEDVMTFMVEAARGDDEKAAQAVHLMTSFRYGGEWADYKVKRWRETSIAEARVGYTYMFVQSNIVEEVKGIIIPMMVICTSHDGEGHRKNPMEQTFGHWFPNVDIQEIQSAGHYPMQETPVSFATVLNAGLKKHAGLL